METLKKILKIIEKVFLALIAILIILNFVRISSEDTSRMLKNKLPEKLDIQAFEKLIKKYNFKCNSDLNQENKNIECRATAVASIFILGSCDYKLNVINNRKIIYVKERDYICAGL